LSAGEQVIVQMLDCLAALITNVTDETPAAIAVTSLNGNLLRHVVHARQECTVCGGVA
jgi:hypothetical protein